jgi:hypothetical protein
MARSRMQSLDVKFVVHHGEFMRQRCQAARNSGGRDVTLLRRQS